MIEGKLQASEVVSYMCGEETFLGEEYVVFVEWNGSVLPVRQIAVDATAGVFVLRTEAR